MKELKGIIHGGEGAFLRCPVSTSVQFSKEFIIKMEGNTAEFSDISGSEIH
jgi:hypothetical protein